MRIRVLIADDEQLFLYGTRVTLEAQGFEVAGEASNGIEVVRLAQSLRPDVVLLDVFLPLLNGFDAAREILHALPATKVALFTAYVNGAYIRAAIRAGIAGYLCKATSPAALISAICEIHRGAIYLCPEAVQATMAQRPRDPQDFPDLLTLREREVLQLIAEGRNMKEAAAILGISAKTAEAHRHRIVAKLNQRNTAHLVRYAVRRAIVPTYAGSSLVRAS